MLPGRVSWTVRTVRHGKRCLHRRCIYHDAHLTRVRFEGCSRRFAGLNAGCTTVFMTDDQHRRCGHEGWVCYCCLTPGKGGCLLRGFVAWLERNLHVVSDGELGSFTLRIRIILQTSHEEFHSHPHYIPASLRSAVFRNNLPSNSTP